MLREVGRLAGEENGGVFTQAAQALHDWDGGYVKIINHDEEPLKVTGPYAGAATRWGLAPNAPSNPNGNLYIAGDQAAGDFILTTVHEVGHIQFGLGHGRSNILLNETCRAAFSGLPQHFKDRAPAHASGSRGC